jgi:hypothetical protein
MAISPLVPVNLQRLANVHNVIHQGPDNGGHKLIGQWASYNGPAGTSLQKVAADTSTSLATLYAVGWTTDPADGVTA